MITEIIEDEVRFRELKEEWDALLERSKSQSIFMTWEWMYSWWKHFGDGKKLLVIVLSDREVNILRGIAPLYIENRIVKLISSEKVAPDFLSFISETSYESDVIKSVFDYLKNQKGIWDTIQLTDLEETAAMAISNLMRDAGNGPWVETHSEECPYIPLPADYDVLIDSFSQKMRSNLRWQTRQISNKYSMKIITANNRSELKSDIDILFDLHNSRFESKNKKSDFSTDEIKKFHYDVAEAFLLRGWLRLYLLKKEAKTIACLYAFRYKNGLFYYQIGFDNSWSRLSLGSVLIGHAIKESIADGLKEFHFLRGNEEYKKRWTGNSLHTKSITITNNTLKGQQYFLFLKIKLAIKRLLKKSTHLDNQNS